MSSIAASIAVLGGLIAAGGPEPATVALAAGPRAPARSASTQGLDVLPFPGTPDAAPGTRVIFPAVPRAELAAVRVVGSRSGLHGGHLRAQPGGRGTAFCPDRPFTPGERVTVIATFRSAAAGAAAGEPGARWVRFSFTVALPPAGGADQAAPTRRRGITSSQPLTYPLVTEPGWTPPIVTMTGKDPDPSSGDIFLSVDNTGQSSPLILSPQGRLVYYQPTAVPGGPPSIRDVRVQTYEGNPVLTYWEGRTVKNPEASRGSDLILNEHYQTIATITAGDGYQSQGLDSHEFVFGHDGKIPVAFATIWYPEQRNLTSVGGPAEGTVFDWIIQEIDLQNGDVLWEWHSLGHVPIDDSYEPYTPDQGYDYFHLNSIEQLPNGHILISARNTWALYSIDQATGKIDWELGGKHSDFKIASDATFQWQHDANLLKKGLLTVFDDATTTQGQSRGLELQVQMKRHRVTLVQQFLHDPPTLATTEGSVQILADGNVFVGWGSKPYFSEYTAKGKQLFSGSFVSPVSSYRAFRSTWVGKPLQPPVIAVESGTKSGEDLVYASWDGSTEVAKWQLLSSSSASGAFAKDGAPFRWSNFETKTQVAAAPYFKVEALGADGKLLATSAAAAGP